VPFLSDKSMAFFALALLDALAAQKNLSPLSQSRPPGCFESPHGAPGRSLKAHLAAGPAP
jgi:hypothetical protein